MGENPLNVRPNVRPHALIVAGALGALILGLIGLTIIARPPDLDDRLRHITKLQAQINQLAKERGDPRAWPKGTICAASLDRAAPTEEARLKQSAEALGLTIGSLHLAADVTRSEGVLSPLGVTLSVTGPYDKILAFLGELARRQPALLVDAVDIKPVRGAVDLQIKGVIWCWTSRSGRF